MRDSKNLMFEDISLCVLWHFMESTQRRAAEAEARVVEEKLFDVVPIPMFVFAATTRKFLAVNDAAIRLYGYSRKEFLSMEVPNLMPPEHSGETDGGIAEFEDRLAPSNAVWTCSREHITKDGSRIHVDVTGRAVDMTRRLVVVQDVTAKRRLEEQVRQAQKMEAIGRVAGGVAHDFNNLLSIMMSYAKLLLVDLKDGQPLGTSPSQHDRMCDDLEEILLAGNRATDLTGQLLLLGRQKVLEPKVLDVNGVLASAETRLRRIVGASVDYASRPAPGLGKVLADPGQVEQVIMNLVVNAHDAMPAGGKLTIETANVVLDDRFVGDHFGSKAGPHVMLAVTDTGTGMDEATRAHMFEPFFTTKEKGRGTGLGLSTVFGIVSESGGTIAVSTEPGKGTSFRIYFPQTDDVVDPSRSGLRRCASGTGLETVHLVEEEERVHTRLFALPSRPSPSAF